MTIKFFIFTPRVFLLQIGSRSSVYSPESRVRKTGSYIYEDFMPTDGTDVKVSMCFKADDWTGLGIFLPGMDFAGLITGLGTE